jgi:hypothetical protein
MSENTAKRISRHRKVTLNFPPILIQIVIAKCIYISPYAREQSRNSFTCPGCPNVSFVLSKTGKK